MTTETSPNSTDRDLGRVEGKLDLLISMFTDRGEKHDAIVKRVTRLEIAVATLLAGSGAYASGALSKIIAFFK